MMIEEIIKNPEESLLYMERSVNDGSPSGFTLMNQTSPETTPLGETESFLLDVLDGTDVKLKEFGEIPPFLKDSGECLRVYIHPDMYGIYRRKGLKIRKSSIMCIPTSSARTVKLEHLPGYLKLNYNGIIGRIDRSLTDRHAALSVELTDYLKKALSKGKYPTLSFFPEPGAVIYKDEEREINFGMVYRDDNIYGKNASKVRILIPVFSLFSKDRNRPEDDCLIIQLINYSGCKPDVYILENVIFPMIENYFKLILNEGIQPEWHAQNLLLGMTEDMSVVSLVMRDLESVDIDQTIQESRGIYRKFSNYPYKYLNVSQYNYQIKHSFMYDFKMGEYVFTPLIYFVCNYYGISIKKVEEKIRDYAVQYLKYLPDDFPPPRRGMVFF